jgi:superfamily I DNA and/or RNA helicase
MGCTNHNTQAGMCCTAAAAAAAIMRRCVVMVGDPQQLPATIFSQAAKQLALERSLFERLAEVRYFVK